MFCPNCGNISQTNQSFCRSCGMDLTNIIEETSKIYNYSDNKTDWIRRIGNFSIGLVLGILTCFFLIFILRAGRFFVDTGIYIAMFPIVILFGFLSVMTFENRQLKKKKVNNVNKQNQLLQDQTEFTNPDLQLPKSAFEPIPSVTESTTELIYVERLKPKISGELS